MVPADNRTSSGFSFSAVYSELLFSKKSGGFLESLRDMASLQKDETAIERNDTSVGQDEARGPVTGDVAYTDDDVLQGRGKGVSKHRGNRLFRKIIKRYCNPYIRAKSNQERRKIVDLVLQEVHSRGRFLEPSRQSSASWVVLTEKKIREKVSQALRYQQRAQSSEADSRSAGSSAGSEGEDEMTHVVGSASGSDTLPAQQLLGKTNQADHPEAMEDIQSWNNQDMFTAKAQSEKERKERGLPKDPLVTDGEILASVGAAYLTHQITGGFLPSLSPQEEVEDLL